MPNQLLFERTIHLFFGDEKALNLAGQVTTNKQRQEWALKVFKEISQIVNSLDSTVGHKEILKSKVEHLADCIKKQEPNWEMIYRLLSFCGSLLGLDARSRYPLRLNTPVYFQTEEQFFSEKIICNLDLSKDKRDAFLAKIKIIKELRLEGFNSFNRVAEI
jgi:hypothetical protein